MKYQRKYILNNSFVFPQIVCPLAFELSLFTCPFYGPVSCFEFASKGHHYCYKLSIYSFFWNIKNVRAKKRFSWLPLLCLK
jgi:hypothetical protein